MRKKKLKLKILNICFNFQVKCTSSKSHFLQFVDEYTRLDVKSGFLIFEYEPNVISLVNFGNSGLVKQFRHPLYNVILFIFNLMEQISEAMESIPQITHKDIKPENILVRILQKLN